MYLMGTKKRKQGQNRPYLCLVLIPFILHTGGALLAFQTEQGNICHPKENWGVWEGHEVYSKATAPPWSREWARCTFLILYQVLVFSPLISFEPGYPSYSLFLFFFLFCSLARWLHLVNPGGKLILLHPLITPGTAASWGAGGLGKKQEMSLLKSWHIFRTSVPTELKCPGRTNLR